MLQTKLLNEQDVVKLVTLTNDPDFDFLSRPRPMTNTEIMVGPRNTMRLMMLLDNFGLEPTVLVKDVSK